MITTTTGKAIITFIPMMKTGAAIYDPIARYHEQIHLPDNTSIFTAEIFGIHITLKYSLQLRENKIFILSDSRCAVQAINYNKKIKVSFHIIDTLHI